MVEVIVDRATSEKLVEPNWEINIQICDHVNNDSGATSEKLVEPNWEINIQICDHVNNDSGISKDVVRAIKRRLASKNPKVQLHSLTLLETVVKNCGEIMHMHVAEKDIPHELVKIVKKKPDFHVKVRILYLIDVWQETFGGPLRRKYPQYYAAYQELLRTGVVFPRRTEKSSPVFTPPQTQPLTSHPPNARLPVEVPVPAVPEETVEPTTESKLPSLNLTDIQTARGMMDVLSEMLKAIDPGNREALKQEVIVDLVEQCRAYRQRVVNLVNTTEDEYLLCQGLALNDELQRLLARQEAIASGTEKLKALPAPSLGETGESSKQADESASSSTSEATQQPLVTPATAPKTNGDEPPLIDFDPKVDWLSGDDYSSPTAADALALVPAGTQQPPSSAFEQNALVPIDFYTSSNNSTHNSSITHSAYPQSPFYPNGNIQTPVGLNPYEQSMYAQNTNPASAWNGQINPPPQHPWSGQISPPQQPSSPGLYGGSLPLAPWEAQHSNIIQHPANQTPQMTSIYPAHATQHVYTTTSTYPPQIYGIQIVKYDYNEQQQAMHLQQQEAMLLQQQMYELSLKNSSLVPTSSCLAPNKPSSPEDKLFGELVDISKFKPTNASTGGAGTV